MNVDDFLSNNVNGFAGAIVLVDTYVPRLYPDIVQKFVESRPCYSYPPEAHHIDQFAFKLSTILRMGRVTALTLLTKDGSPHSVQMHMTAQEAAANVGFPDKKVGYFVVENGILHEITKRAVRRSRHLSEIASEVAQEEAIPPTKHLDDNKIAILIGGRSDLPTVRDSSLFDTLRQLGIAFQVTVISSEQNPDELRTYCKSLHRRQVRVVVCIAGSVPGLPAAVKAHLPTTPVIAVPLTGGGLTAREIMLGSLSVPARRPIILSGLDRVGLKKAARLSAELIGLSDERVATAYERFVDNETPAPDYWVSIDTAEDDQLTSKESAGGK